MAISYLEAVNRLTDRTVVHTVASLFELVGEVSGAVVGAPPGSTYLLFSGGMPDGTTGTGAIAAEIVNQSTDFVYDIGTSQVGKLLGDERFAVALDNAVAREQFGRAYSELNEAQLVRVEEITQAVSKRQCNCQGINKFNWLAP